VKIHTNNARRPVIDAYELTHEERKEFDYLDWDAIDKGEDSAQFFRYKGELYDIGEFCRVVAPNATRCHPTECAEPAFQGWSGYQSDSYFSGLLIRWADDFESVVVGWYCS